MSDAEKELSKAARSRYSVYLLYWHNRTCFIQTYLLYWYKSTNTDAVFAALQAGKYVCIKHVRLCLMLTYADVC